MAGASGPQEQLLQMCFGQGERELNLAAVTARVQDLRRTLDLVVADLAEGRGAHWAAFLDRLAVINVQHLQILSHLRPLLRQYVSFPKFVDSPQVEADVPSLLASRLLPDQEAEEADARLRLLGPSQQPEVVLAAAEQQLEGLRAAAAALGGGPDGPGCLDKRGPQRAAIDALSAQTQRAIAAQQAARARGAGDATNALAAAPLAAQRRGGARGGPSDGGGSAADAAAAAESAADEKLLRDLASGAAYRNHHAGASGGK